MRGSSSHGWGHKKKHRGAGHRGGVGLSGTGARGDQKKSMILKKFGNSYFGKKGFTSIHKSDNKVLSIAFIENNFDKMVENGSIVKEGETFVFDATAYGVDKMLGNCKKFNKKVTVVCKDISETAKSRIVEAGGVVECAKEDSE